MTLSEIHAMFAPGDTWTAVRTPGLGGALQTKSVRTIKRVRSKDYISTHNGNDGNFYGSLPERKRDVIEARPGYLKFQLGKDVVVELTKGTEA